MYVLCTSSHQSRYGDDVVLTFNRKKLKFRGDNCFASGYNKELRSANSKFHVLPSIVCWLWHSPQGKIRLF